MQYRYALVNYFKDTQPLVTHCDNLPEYAQQINKQRNVSGMDSKYLLYNAVHYTKPPWDPHNWFHIYYINCTKLWWQNN